MSPEKLMYHFLSMELDLIHFLIKNNVQFLGDYDYKLQKKVLLKLSKYIFSSQSFIALNYFIGTPL